MDPIDGIENGEDHGARERILVLCQSHRCGEYLADERQQ
jgi:hypothetical protein